MVLRSSCRISFEELRYSSLEVTAPGQEGKCRLQVRTQRDDAFPVESPAKRDAECSVGEDGKHIRLVQFEKQHFRMYVVRSILVTVVRIFISLHLNERIFFLLISGKGNCFWSVCADTTFLCCIRRMYCALCIFAQKACFVQKCTNSACFGVFVVGRSGQRRRVAPIHCNLL